MLTSFKFVEALSWKPVYEDPPADPPKDPPADPPKDPPADPPKDPPADPPKGDGKKFSQDDLDRIVQNRVKNMKTELDSMTTKLKDASISSELKGELENQLEQVQNTLKTEKELATEKQKKLQKKHTEELKKTTGERDAWEKRYKKERIERDIMSAAVEQDAFSPKQVIRILRDDTFITEELGEDGKPTGELTSMVKVRDIKDNQPVDLELSPADAVKRMKENVQEFGNLFQSEASAGLGLANLTKKTGGTGTQPPLEDQAAYEAWRKENQLSKVK